ncbi:MAG: alcohol dehydrogenase catalytic domain-containing protein, partial [Planctomycetia bacterium]|nr:alcohol dehydrogenase catalytic domain-containing protein [Planctomycetia bacterium]
MKAAIYRGPKDVVLQEVDAPRPGPREVLVKVEVALTCGTDRKMYLRGHPLFKPPFVFGHEFAGTVVEVGSEVTGFAGGERVVAANSAPCNECFYCRRGSFSMCENLFLRLSGAFAEYIEIPEPIVRQNLLKIPGGVSFRDAALLEPLACVVHGIERSGIRPGDTVVVNGAGPIGLMFIRLAALKCERVIATDINPERLEIARILGAAETVNAAEVDDVVVAVRELTDGGRGVDVAIEAVGLPEVWQRTIAMVRKSGVANLFGGCASGTSITVDTSLIHYSEVTIKGVFHHTPASVRRAMEYISAGE